MTSLNKKQVKALEMIDKIEEHFGSRWFVQQELPSITMHTIDVLVERGHLLTKHVQGIEYYKLKIVVVV